MITDQTVLSAVVAVLYSLAFLFGCGGISALVDAFTGPRE